MAKDVEKFKTSVNDVTGDLIKSKASSQKAYADNWERIFGKKTEENVSDDTPADTTFTPELLPEGVIEDEQ